MSAVVVTGIGAVTPFGPGAARAWQALAGGESCLSKLELFDLRDCACTQAGVCSFVKEGDEPRAQQLAACAGTEALNQSGVPREGLALYIASNFFSDASSDGGAPTRDCAALRSAFSLAEPGFAVSLSCASGASALALASEAIAAGRYTRALVIGYDALAPFSWSGLCSLRAMSPTGTVRPFSATRDGTIFSEGAAAMVLESAEDAHARGATILAQLLGWATGNNGYHLTAPAPHAEGSREVMVRALARAGVQPSEVAFVQAHATGTRANDETEAEALHAIFGATLPPIGAAKGVFGHMLGAASICEAAMAICALREKTLPPIAPCEDPDPACGIVPARLPTSLAPGVALCNAAGFGGCNAALVFSEAHVSSADCRVPSGNEERQPNLKILARGYVGPWGLDVEEALAAHAEGERGQTPSYVLEEMGVTPKAYVDPTSKHLLAAACRARDDAALAPLPDDGIFVGTEKGCVSTVRRFAEDLERKGPRLVRPFLFPHAYSNAPASLLAMELGARGAHANFAGEGASAAAFAAAVDALRAGACRRAWVAQAEPDEAAVVLLTIDDCRLSGCGGRLTIDDCQLLKSNNQTIKQSDNFLTQLIFAADKAGE